MGWRRNLKKRRRAGYAATGEAVPQAYNAPGRKRKARRPVQGVLVVPGAATVQDATQPRPGDQVTQPTAGPVTEPAATPSAVSGDGQSPISTALFETRSETHKDARLARMAIKRSWEPQPLVTQAILTKAASKALEEHAKVEHIVAIAKLHLDAHGKVMAEEHHNDRMDYHERALQVRAKVGDYVPGGPQINVNTGGGPAAVSIFLPAVDDVPIDTIEGEA